MHTDAVANATGREVECGDYLTGSVQVTSSHVAPAAYNADVQVQISNNGVDWVNVGAVINTETVTDVANIRTRYIRTAILNYVDGIITVILVLKAHA